MFLFFKIIFDLFLVLSPHVILLSLIFINNIFLVLNLILIEKINELNSLFNYKQLFLYLKPEITDILVFYKFIKTFYKY